MKVAILTFTSVLFLLFSVSCSGHRDLIEPDIAIVDMKLDNVTFFETSALFTVRIDNENPYPLEIDSGVHRFYVNDVYVGKGFDRDGLTVQRLGSEIKEIKVNISNLSMFTKLQSLFEKDELSYRIDSTLHMGSFGSRDVRLSKAGSFRFGR